MIEKIRDDLYVDKGIFGGYRMVYPFRNDDKTWNKRNIILFFIKFFGVIIIACLLLYFYNQDIKACKNMYSDIIEEMKENTINFTIGQPYYISLDKLNFTLQENDDDD